MAGRRLNAGGTLFLDSEGLVKLARDDARAQAYLRRARARAASVCLSAVTLTETLRGHPRDAELHRVLRRINVLSVSPAIARAAGELLGHTGLSGHRCAIDAIVAATAMACLRPVVILTSDHGDLAKLVQEPSVARAEAVVVQRI
ncbi:PIN domain-containing protein [Stackebrandtia albiflava]|uniref:PIN domain-containing protein n=1 Tax=Stackebrandtia albiflava TaxID=406432 RepID=A0A562V3R8_9ACTN|nr:PIN domain-containing protein [Stackebrandtia albiflava]TWJ12472.1 PIN domain-containing protein [Stackebrandtia albiflava]